MTTTRHKARVATWKRTEVDELSKIIEDSPVVAIARIDKLPSAQFQMVREKSRGRATIRVTKNNLLRLAFERAKDGKVGLDQLEAHLAGQVALICSDMNPFKLFKTIEGSKAKAPAKAGDLAPIDIEVKRGDTPFKPGPIVGDLQKAGIPAKIESGKVVIASDKVLVHKGDAISPELASALARLEIYPMIVGLDVKAVWEHGTVFGRDVLAVDDAAVLRQVQLAHAQATSLALEAAYPAIGIVDQLLGRAVRQARGVAVEGAFPAPQVMDLILARAERQALAVARKLSGDALSDKIKEKLK